MIIFIMISIITTVAGILSFLYWSIMIARYTRLPDTRAMVIKIYDRRFNHKLLMYEYKVDMGEGKSKQMKGPWNINFSPFNLKRYLIGDIVSIKYDSRFDRILSKPTTILFCMMTGLMIMLIGFIMLVATGSMIF